MKRPTIGKTSKLETRFVHVADIPCRWYFDVVSADAQQSVTVVFYNSGPHGFINSYENAPLSVSLTGLLPNGSAYSFTAPASGAVVSNEKGGIATSAVFEDSGFSFNGTNSRHGDVSYVIVIDNPSLGIQGTITLKSLAPPHYPCGFDVPGATEELIPHVYWSNAIPDARAHVDLDIGGTKVEFTGSGYHDKNWGDVPFVTTTDFWYWGHAHLGPYSIVWFDAVDSTGKEVTSGYIAKNGKPLLGSCAPKSVSVRPWGSNDTYPPVISTGVMQGLEVMFDMGHGEEFVANVTTAAVAIDAGSYIRTTGTVTGGPCGSKRLYEGSSLFEEFKFKQA